MGGNFGAACRAVLHWTDEPAPPGTRQADPAKANFWYKPEAANHSELTNSPLHK